jgi:hypothetical protein
VLRLDLFGSDADHGAAPVLAAPADSAIGLPRIIEFTWRRSAPSATYGFQLARDIQFTIVDVDLQGLTDTTRTVGPLLDHTRYWWRVSGRDDRGMEGWSLTRMFVTKRTVAALVRPGDTNNDGMVDVLDITPIGLHTGRTGSARPYASLEWADGGQVVPVAWEPPAACYSDCDGNGRVEAADVVGVIENWGRRLGSPPPPDDRAAACWELLRVLDAEGSTEALRAIRMAVVDYLRSRLGIRLQFMLEPPSPNPFRDTITLRFMLPEAVAEATLAVYNARGSLVARSSLRSPVAGMSSLTWNGNDLQGSRAPSGVYFYKLAAGPHRTRGRIILVR